MKNEMNLAKEVMNAVINKVPSVCGYVQINKYTSKFDEVTSRKIVVGKFANAKEKSIAILNDFDVTNIDTEKMNSAIERAFKGRVVIDLNLDAVTLERIKAYMIDKLVNPNVNSSKGQTNAYTNITNGVKSHKEKNDIRIWGKEVEGTKEIHVHGVYPKNKNGKDKKSGHDVVMRDVITHYLDLPHSKYRNFIIDAEQLVKTNGNVIEFLEE